MKRLRLRSWVKSTLMILAFSAVVIPLIKTGLDRYTRIAESCDEARGYVCTDYDIRDYAIKGK